MSNPGLPELCEDLGQHFQHVAALFGESVITFSPVSSAAPVVSAPLLPVVNVVTAVSDDSAVAIQSRSPSADLPPFWKKNQHFYSFLLISFNAFTGTLSEAEDFPASSVGPGFPPGSYVLQSVRLMRYADDNWVQVLRFPSSVIPQLPRGPKPADLYFNLT
jgi:hypothetical protein